jgi:hypothetical protein
MLENKKLVVGKAYEQMGIAGFKPTKLPPKIDAGNNAQKPLKPLLIIHIVTLRYFSTLTNSMFNFSILVTNSTGVLAL